MVTTTLIIRVDPDVKYKAQRQADALGVSLSAVLQNELKRFAEEGVVTFHADYEANKHSSTRVLPVRLEKKDAGMLMLRSRREGIPLLMLLASILRQAAARVPLAVAPVPETLPVGHVCDKCSQAIKSPS